MSRIVTNKTANTYLIPSIWAWGSLNIADILLTLWAIGLGAIELNPVMRWSQAISPWAFISIKASLASFIALYYLRANRHRPLIAACVIQGLVVLLNVYVITSKYF